MKRNISADLLALCEAFIGSPLLTDEAKRPWKALYYKASGDSLRAVAHGYGWRFA